MRGELLTVRGDATGSAGRHRQPGAGLASARGACLRTLSRRCRAASLAVAYAASSVLGATAVAAQGLPLIRDAEIENLLKDYSRPIFKAAGLGSQNISMRIIRHESFNAFVVDGRNVFINTGTLAQAKTPNEVIGVIAHESGHITGGHLAQLRARIARDQTKAILLTVLGIGLMVGGAVSGGDTAREVGGAGGGLAMGGNEMIMRSLLSERRAQESAADQAGLRYLEATKQSGQGMLETFERFAQQEYISATYQDPFVRSHPIATDRLAQLRNRVAASPYASAKDPPELQLRHDMMRAKLHGFMDRPDTLARAYPPSDTSLAARYARAIAAYRYGSVQGSIQQIDALIASQPGNPYFHELKGQALLEAGRPAEAVGPLRQAIAHAPNPTLIQVMLGQALTATGNPALTDEAVRNLTAAINRDPDITDAYTNLAMAYGKKGDLAQADLASAQAAFTRGDFMTARQLAVRAKGRFAVGTPGWVKADDIAAFKAPAAAMQVNRR